MDWDWNLICSYSRGLTIDIINDNPDLPWGYDKLLDQLKEYISLQGLRKILSKYIYWVIENDDLKSKIDPILETKKNLWERIKDKIKINDYIDMYKLSQDVNLTLNIINKYPELDWKWYNINENPNIDKKQILNPKFKEYVLMYPKITDILENLDYNWDWNFISKSDNITMNDITNNPTLPWDWTNVCENPNLTFEFIQENLSKPFNWRNWSEISKHKNITMEHVIQHPDYPWNYKSLSDNPNLTIDFVLQNQDKDWDLYCLSMAQFTYSCDIYNKTVKNTILNTPLCIQNLTGDIIKFI